MFLCTCMKNVQNICALKDYEWQIIEVTHADSFTFNYGYFLYTFN